MATFSFNVWLGSKLIDTVFNTVNEWQTIQGAIDEVRRGLIEHDGYSPDIRVTWPKGQRLTRTVYDLRGRYPSSDGEETLCSATTFKEAKADKRAYLENDPTVSGLRIVAVRERI